LFGPFFISSFEAVSEKNKNNKEKGIPLTQGDYYFNAQGMMVFTAQYHLRRGFCCESGCKHCPYGYKRQN
jgi:hypothetical protein